MTPHHAPTPETLQQLALTELSTASRMRHVALLVVAAVATSIVAALLVTEPALPMRTRGALLVLCAIGSAWIAFAAWVLRARHMMLAWHRVIAARIAVAGSGLYAAGAAAAVLLAPRPAAFGALAAGLAMLGTAAAALVVANRRHTRLRERRDALERELGQR
jgi:hypothetical protein